MTTVSPSDHRGRGPHGRLSRWAVGVVVAAAVMLVLSQPWPGPSHPIVHPAIRAATVPRVQAGPVNLGPVPLSSSEFAAGSCVALAPTSGDRHQTVFLDAGHGGPDPGTASGTTESGQNIEEKAVTLPVALDTAQVLRAQGYRVVLSRTGDSSVARLTAADINGALLTTQGEHTELLARAACANLSGAAAMVSIHFDAYPDPSVGGATTLYDTARTFAAANQTLATALQQDIVTSLASGGWQVPDRGSADDTTAGGGEITAAGTAYGHIVLLGPDSPGYVDNPTTMPGALVEPLFLSDPAEATIAVNPVAQQAIATGIATALGQFLPPHG
jgi:N-acetylmuramoyl-L-alanine amidase